MCLLKYLLVAILVAASEPTAAAAAALPSPVSSDDLMSCIIGHSSSARAVDAAKYNDSRIGTNFRYDDYYPALILNVTSVSDIQAAVKCAARFAINIVPMNGGHSFEGMSCTQDLLLHLDQLRNVLSFEKSGEDTLVTVEAGLRLARLYGLVIEYSDSMAAPPGSGVAETYVIAGGTCPTVGVIGHMLCGGYGMLGRQVGLTSDQIVGITYVNADGHLQVANAENENNDIFWAMKGGCSSAFGIVVSVTLKLLKLQSPAITTVDIPLIPYNAHSVEEIALWWQHWSSADLDEKCTSTWHFTKNGIRMQAVYLGPKDSYEFLHISKQMYAGLRSIFSLEEIMDASTEGTFLDAVLWWSDDDDLQSLDDLLAVTSLPSLETRSASRRKSKSLIALKHVIPPEGVRQIIQYTLDKALNAVEWKTYGGVNTLSNEFYTDNRSPLLRGHLLEMHYGNSYSSNASAANDEVLVKAVNTIGDELEKYFAGPSGYIGYIDYELNHPGASYFGPHGAGRLASIRHASDPTGVLSTPASSYLYPAGARSITGRVHFPERSENKTSAVDIYVGSFNETMSRWKLSSTGKLSFVETTECKFRNPTWLERSRLSGRTYAYSVNQVKDFPQPVDSLELAMGGLSSYVILENGSLRYLNSVSSGGGSPNHATLSELTNCRVLYAANSCGSVSVHSILPNNGTIAAKAIQVVLFNENKNDIKVCNSSTFLHQVYAFADNIYVVDRDSDRVYHFKRNTSTGIIDVSSRELILLPHKSGPRHLTFHPSLNYAFLVSEFSSTISTLLVQPNGTLALINTQTMLRPNESNVDMAAAEVKISKDGRFLYGSNRDTSDPNRNRSSIVVFECVSHGLNILQHISSEGIHPRHFNIFEFGGNESDVLVVANKDSSSLSTFVVNGADGHLKFTGNTVSTLLYHDEPVFVL